MVLSLQNDPLCYQSHNLHAQLQPAPGPAVSRTCSCTTASRKTAAMGLQVREVFEDVTASGAPPSLAVWNALLGALAATGSWREALDALKQVPPTPALPSLRPAIAACTAVQWQPRCARSRMLLACGDSACCVVAPACARAAARHGWVFYSVLTISHRSLY